MLFVSHEQEQWAAGSGDESQAKFKPFWSPAARTPANISDGLHLTRAKRATMEIVRGAIRFLTPNRDLPAKSFEVLRRSFP